MKALLVLTCHVVLALYGHGFVFPVLYAGMLVLFVLLFQYLQTTDQDPGTSEEEARKRVHKLGLGAVLTGGITAAVYLLQANEVLPTL